MGTDKRIIELLKEAKSIAREYYGLTGKPLGITGEVPEYEAARILRVKLTPPRQAGHDAIWLGVWERNGRAQAFYRKWNFRAVGQHVFQLGSDPQRDILMQRAV